MNFEIMDRPYGIALYYRATDGELYRVGGFKDEGEAEDFILDCIEGLP